MCHSHQGYSLINHETYLVCLTLLVSAHAKIILKFLKIASAWSQTFTWWSSSPWDLHPSFHFARNHNALVQKKRTFHSWSVRRHQLNLLNSFGRYFSPISALNLPSSIKFESFQPVTLLCWLQWWTIFKRKVTQCFRQQ